MDADASVAWRHNAHVRAEGGFSLIELMVTVAIVAILATIAFPTYRAYVLKTNRADAMRALTEDAQILQRCYSEAYTFVGCAPIPPAAPAFTTSPNGYYDLSSTILVGPPQTFVLTAAAVGAQADDTACATFSVNQAGQQTAQNSSNSDNSAACWGSN
ncbi:MAG TPA: type IV pilin protein [Steroidobacteraceae bacterium]|jgi:type IV pilus assembly protein PilE|nr:type IV pilin protein [Steroidobacteraceae bacterium]